MRDLTRRGQSQTEAGAAAAPPSRPLEYLVSRPTPSTPRCALRRGFTLIELIVVVIIIAVLAAVAAVAYNQYASRARSNAVLASASDLRTAVMAAAARDDHASADEAALLWDAAGKDSTAFLTALDAHYDGPVTFTAASDSGPATLLVGSAGSGAHTACLVLTEPPTVHTGNCGSTGGVSGAPGDGGSGTEPASPPAPAQFAGTYSTVTAGTSQVTAVAASSPTGTWYALNAGNGTVTAYRGQDSTLAATIPVASPTAATVSPDGHTLYVASGTGTVTVIDTATNQVRTTVTVAAGAHLFDIAITPDGRTVYTDDRTSSVYVLDADTDTAKPALTIPGSNPGNIAATDTRLYVGYGNGTQILALNLTDLTQTWIGVGNGTNGVHASRDGTRVYVSNYYSNSVSVIDAATNTVTATIAGVPGPEGILPSLDGSVLYVSNVNGGVSVIDVASGKLAGTLASPGWSWPGWQMALSADGSALYVPYAGGVAVLQ